MNRSKVGSASVVAINVAGNDIGPFYVAADVPTRLFIKNRGGTQVQLAFDASAVNGSGAATSSSDRYELEAGDTVALIVAPGQSVYAVGIGAGRVTWAASDALPLDGVA